MRILMFGKSKARTRTNLYYQKSFRKLGHTARWIRFRKLRSWVGHSLALFLSKKFATWFKPDMIFFYLTDIPIEILHEWTGKIPMVMLNEDCIDGVKQGIHQIVAYGQKSTTMYLTDTGELDYYRERGVNAQFITGGCDPQAHRIEENPPDFYKSDVAFIGKPNTRERTEFIRELSQKFDLKLWGSGWPKEGLKTWKKNAYPPDYRKICAGAKILLGWHIDATIAKYTSNRTWYTLGCGGFLLTQYSPEMEEIFKRGFHLDWFESQEECCEKIEYYLSHEDERKKIARQGYELAHSEYSFDKLAERIIGDIKKTC